MNTILLTGASGFVGSNLKVYLERKGYDTLSLNLREKEWSLPSEALAIIHLAGKAHDTSNTADPEAYFQVNTKLTIQLFDAFLKSGVKDFFYFSSVKAVADTVDGEVLTEDVAAVPKTPYGQSKRQAEQYLSDQELPAGKRLFIIRPCMIHGPGNKGNLNLLYKFVAKGIPYPLAAFENKRSFLSIDNLNYAIEELLKSTSAPSGIYNLADDDALSTNEVVKLIAAAIGKQPRLLSVPPGLLNLAARVGDALKLPLNRERLKKLTENYVVSNEKIKQALHLQSLPVSAKDGLTKTIRSFRAI